MVKLADSLPEPDDYEGAERTETLAMAGLVRLLPWPQRQQLLREARLLMEKAEAMSGRARHDSMRFHRAALVRRALSLKSLW